MEPLNFSEYVKIQISFETAILLARPGVVHATMLMGHEPDTDPLCV